MLTVRLLLTILSGIVAWRARGGALGDSVQRLKLGNGPTGRAIQAATSGIAGRVVTIAWLCAPLAIATSRPWVAVLVFPPMFAAATFAHWSPAMSKLERGQFWSPLVDLLKAGAILSAAVMAPALVLRLTAIAPPWLWLWGLLGFGIGPAYIGSEIAHRAGRNPDGTRRWASLPWPFAGWTAVAEGVTGGFVAAALALATG